MTDLLFPVFRPSSEAETRENEFLIDYLALVCFFVMMLGLGRTDTSDILGWWWTEFALGPPLVIMSL